MTNTVLTFIVLCPLVACVLVMLIPERQALLVRLVSLIGAALTVPPAIWACMAYDRTAGGFQFAHRVEWIPNLGVAYSVAADGVSLVLVLLTAVIITAGIAASWTVKLRTKEFMALLLLLTGGVFGVFVARDLFFLFLFFEVSVLPMYLLIGVWGSTTKLRTKEYSAMKLTLMLLGGSAFVLVAILALYFHTVPHTFDMGVLASRSYPADFQRWVFLAVYIGFGVLAGIWPLHTWSPDGHASAPTAVSMLHAGVLMKLGAYGVLRLGIVTLGGGAAEWSLLMAVIATINILYGAFSAIGQTDLKYVIAYSSVSHMGVVMLGLASMTPAGLTGATLQMAAHGLMTGLTFALVGLVYEKSHTRDIPSMGGFAGRMPGIATCMTIAGCSSIGLPATFGFVAEFLCLYGSWQKYPALTLFAAGGVVVSAVFVLRMLQKVFLGEHQPDRYPDLGDARTSEWVAITSLSVLLFAAGMAPRALVRLADIWSSPPRPMGSLPGTSEGTQASAPAASASILARGGDR